MRTSIAIAGADIGRMLSMLPVAIALCLSPIEARDLPRPGTFAVKHVPEQRIIYVVHHGPDHIAASFAKLVAYYLKDSLPFTVVFPQMTISVSDSESWVAVAYTGEARETGDVKLGTIPAGTVASRVCQGSYERISEAIQGAYRRIAASKKYLPRPGTPPRLLYWNSPDDHLPRDLITEIQIPVIERPRGSGK